MHPLNAGSNPFGWGSPSFPRCALFLGLKPQFVRWFVGGKLWLLDVLHIFASWEKTFKKTNGPIHLDCNFPGMNFNLELKSNTFCATKNCLHYTNLSWRDLVRSLYSLALSYASNRISSSSCSCNFHSSPVFLASRLHCFTAQKARCSISTSKWHNLVKTNLYSDIPIGVLYVIQYAQSASFKCRLQSFRLGFTIFSKMCFISRFETLVCPLVCGWKVVATRCTPYFHINASTVQLQKRGPWSFIIAIRIPNLLKMLDLRNPTNH